MVLELAKYAPLLFVCLRPKYGTILDEFPPSDEPVVSYFLKDADSFRPDQDDKGANGDKPAFYFTYDLQVAAFLGAWFEVLAADLQTCTDASSMHELLLDLNRFGSGPGSQSAGINSNILQRRDAFFGRVCQAAQTKVTEVATHPDTTAYHTDTFASCLTEGIRALATELRQVRDYLWSLDSNQHVRQQIDDMLAGEWTKPEFDKPPIFVAADDCVQLIEQTSGTSGGDHRLNSLRRAWNYINSQQSRLGTPTFWLVLLSTDSAATMLAEPRARARMDDLAPTFVGLGFDVIRLETESLSSAGQVGELEHIRSYGRPLWVSIPDIIFWVDAQSKLLGIRMTYNMVAAKNLAMVSYNILASRLALRFVPVKGGSSAHRQQSLASGSVERHMRMLEAVVDESRLRVGSPSEPILAVAAALIMLPITEVKEDVERYVHERYRTIVSDFRREGLPLLKDGALQGGVGELAARFVWMAAWDAAKLPLMLTKAQHYRNLERVASTFHCPLPAMELLRGLATFDQPSLDVLERRIGSVCSQVRETLRRESEVGCAAAATSGRHEGSGLPLPGGSLNVEAWTNFTHFEVLPTDIQRISSDYLWYCWKRGVALQIEHSRYGVDGIIPVFVGDLSRDFGPSDGHLDTESGAARHMTFIAWEAKKHVDPTPSEILRGPSLRGPKLLPAEVSLRASASTRGVEHTLTTRGLLTVLMEVGVSASIKDGQQPKAWSRAYKGKPQRGTKRKAEESAAKDINQGESSFSQGAPVTQLTAPQNDDDDDDEFVWVTIRGKRAEEVYPCLDTLGVRNELGFLVLNLPIELPYEVDNGIDSPVHSRTRQPEVQRHIKQHQDDQ